MIVEEQKWWECTLIVGKPKNCVMDMTIVVKQKCLGAQWLLESKIVQKTQRLQEDKKYVDNMISIENKKCLECMVVGRKKKCCMIC